MTAEDSGASGHAVPASSSALHDLYRRIAVDARYDTSVTELEHALQTAMLAEADGADDDLVIAALCHDIGHLLGELLNLRPAAGGGVSGDRGHEHVGAAYLRVHFGPAVAEPVAMHVMAKRYLAAVAPSYAATLSPASARSLRAQGGALGANEVAAFRAHPTARAALRLRGWDDWAKVPGLRTPDLDHWSPLLRRRFRPADAPG